MEEEISLRELIEIILAGKRTIIIFTLVAIFISAFFSFGLITPVYEAKAVITVKEIDFSSVEKLRLEGLVAAFTEIPLIEAQSFLAQVQAEPVLVKVKEGLAGEISTAVLAKKIKVTNPQDTNLVEIVAQGENAQEAAQLANLFAQELSEFVIESNQEKAVQNLELLEKQLLEEQIRYAEAVEEMKQFLKQTANAAELTAELEANHLLLSELQMKQSNLQIETEALLILVRTLEKQLLEIPERIRLEGNLSDNSLVTSLSEVNETLNPVYLELKTELALKKSLQAQYHAEKTLVEAEIAKVRTTIKNLQISLVDTSQEVEIQTGIDVAQRNYELYFEKYHEAKMIKTLQAGEEMVIIREANLPQAPVTPKKALNLAIATCLGLMLGFFVVLFRAYWFSTSPEKNGF